MLDKYTGDGIMAIFGAPLETAEHAVMACNAALGFKKLSTLTIEAKHKSIPLITRLGINSGNFVVGNIGSSNRMDYTAIGDTVNLSARLEGVNKQYGTQNIISETTYALVKDRFICRELDLIRVKGREKPLAIYNVISANSDLTTESEKLLECTLRR
jgi:adenylate cyclase